MFRKGKCLSQAKRFFSTPEGKHILAAIYKACELDTSLSGLSGDQIIFLSGKQSVGLALAKELANSPEELQSLIKEQKEHVKSSRK